MTLKVEGRPELERDEHSKGIKNVDDTAYNKYINAALARKQRNASLEKNTEDINNLKEDVSEIKDMLRQLINK